MSFTDFDFLVFLAVVTGLFRLCPLPLRSLLLVSASYVFYLTWSASATILLAAVTALTFGVAIAIEKSRGSRRGVWMGPCAVAILVAYLLAFKIALLGPTHGIAGLVMPLGISYTAFKLISYVLEVHWGKMNACRRPADFGAYIAFFPQILAGPIQRPAGYFCQLPPAGARIMDALPRIAWGLVKKLIIADNLAPAVNYVYVNVAGLHGAPLLYGAPLWAAFYLFPLQIYADFSGLTDIAIGTGRLLGITGPENFNRPFTATSISDFWRRWHMSLTSWLGDYVFLPLRMLTREAGKPGLAFSICVNMIAIALWHGLTTSYLAFGVLHSIYLTIDAFTQQWRKRLLKRNPDWDKAASLLGCALTFHLVAIALVFFRAAHVQDAFWLLENLFTGLSASGNLFWTMVDVTGARVLTVGLAGYVLLEFGERFRPDRWLSGISRGPRPLRWSAICAAAMLFFFGVLLLLAHSGGPRSPFLYEIF